MTLIKAVLQKVMSRDDTRHHTEDSGKYVSPPPEIDVNIICKRLTKKYRKRRFMYDNVQARVDTSPPLLGTYRGYHNLGHWSHDMKILRNDNIRHLMMIRKAQILKGKVDCHWKLEPINSWQYYRNRVDMLKKVHRDNLAIYKRIITTSCRVTPASSLNKEWARNRSEIINRAVNRFVLFPPRPHEDMEDLAFAPPAGFKRPRVYMTIGLQGGAVLGELCIELFTDVCPGTCQLFTELMDGDTLGHGFVGTCFFKKVPDLYWSGGDVIHNNGFGCYAQRGRVEPVGAENFHFSHSMPGLLSMRVTCDNEVCGIFNVTFKPLPQFDLHNVVFARIIRPSVTYETARMLGRALSTYPVVNVVSTRRKQNNQWVKGEMNTRLLQETHTRETCTRRS